MISDVTINWICRTKICDIFFLFDWLADWKLLDLLLARMNKTSLCIHLTLPLVAVERFGCVSFRLIFMHGEFERLVQQKRTIMPVRRPGVRGCVSTWKWWTFCLAFFLLNLSRKSGLNPPGSPEDGSPCLRERDSCGSCFQSIASGDQSQNGKSWKIHQSYRCLSHWFRWFPVSGF